MVSMSEAFIVLPGQGRRLDLGNFEAVVLATAAQTDGQFSLLRTSCSHSPQKLGACHPV